MQIFSPKLFRQLALTVLFSFAANTAHSEILSRQQAEVDLESWIDWTIKTHPDLSHSVDDSALRSMASQVKNSLPQQLDTNQLWRYFSLINPILNDGHMAISYPKQAFQDYKSDGGAIFPLSLTLNEKNQLTLTHAYKEIPAHTPITSVNKLSASQIVNDLMLRMHGDSDGLRRELISRRFAAYFWSMYGGVDNYTINVKHNNSIKIFKLNTITTSASDVPKITRFQHQSLKASIAYLYIQTFEKSHSEEFAEFLKQSFTKIKQQGSTDLIIDLRDNSGGAHDLSDQLVNYITHKRVTPISKVKARVVPENQKLLQGAKLGAVVSTPYAKWYQPDTTNDLRFTGKVYVLIGKFTYSQSIAFSTEMQDFKLATLVGEATAGRANQTGQVQQIKLAESGLTVFAPIYIMIRASGDTSASSLKPNIRIDDDSSNTNVSIERLIEIIKEKRAE